MDIIIHDIVYFDDGLGILIKLPEELIGEKVLLEIFRRNTDFPFVIFRKEIIPESSEVDIIINCSDFKVPKFINLNEVWDVRLKVNLRQLTLQNIRNDVKTYYLKKPWKNFNFKPYWTKENNLAFFIKFNKTNLQYSIKDIYISKNLLIRAEIYEIESKSKYFILLNDETFEEKYRIDTICYFEIPISNLPLDNTGNFNAKIALLVLPNGNQPLIMIPGADSEIFKVQNDKFKIKLSIDSINSILQINKKKKGISIIGSCVSRDNFNRHFNEDYKKDYEMFKLQNQTSIISLVSKPITYNTNEINNIGDWEAEQLCTELDKSFFRNLNFRENDFIILDFFSDVYFGVINFDGMYITNNYWVLQKTNLYKRLSSYPKLNIINNFDAYFELWRRSIHEFFRRVSIILPHSKIILHKARFTDSYIKDDGSVALFNNAKEVSKYNKAWSALDRYIEANFDVIPISIDEGKLISTENHKWGKFNVHYDLPYYHEFIKRLREISED
ncbi:hypothetical protein E2K98_08920 [Bacillus salipaludis]|uniref:Uncharacterized protein n=1 Tax=Bacillus salipaludis TaxID=2547811 RepID=A0A4V3ATY6_9BACI|nr:DUF6270 domain-containing protein [Bacillus salipaludis]TDK62176.1 hypothetical protein E2K98_08920 [Bacillus salipaludis]